jgi:glycosyltransferase involved in cell wall biosynthesis
MSLPLVTVLMPMYNAERHLHEAIDSILHQTLTDFEFLIIDDASTDKSIEIINSYTDSRIRLIRNEKNLGISATLNKGIEIASTELIARMDADDISYPTRLQKQYDFFQSNPDFALLSTSTRVVSPDNKPIRIDKFDSEYYYYNLNFICWMYHSTIMYKRSVVIDVGKYAVPYSEDFDLFWQISRKYKIYNLREVLLDYRESDESLSTNTKREEYENSQHKQVLRNIHYYTGSNYHLTYDEIECFRHDFIPLLEQNNCEAIIICVKKLDFISNCISKAVNVNNNPTAVQEAAYYKKEFILNYFYSNLPWFKSKWLIIRTGYFRKKYLSIVKRIFK